MRPILQMNDPWAASVVSHHVMAAEQSLIYTVVTRCLHIVQINKNGVTVELFYLGLTRTPVFKSQQSKV